MNVNNETSRILNIVVEEEPSVINHREKCLEKLKTSKLLEKLTAILDESGQLSDFMHLLEYLADKTFPCRNIVFVLLMERIRFQSCANTTGMRYCELTKKFWSIVYKLCKGVGLKFFSGEKNWGQVVSKETRKSKYCPRKSKINFAVPDEKVLRNYNRFLPKVIPPGKIESSLNLLTNKKDIIIMGDGKMVMKGLKANFEGDINLFGHERGPNLEDLKNEMENKLNYISKCVRKFGESNIHDKFNMLLDLVDIITNLISRVKNFHQNEKRKLNMYVKQKEKGPKNVPDKAISACKTNMYTVVIWIRQVLILNLNLAKLSSALQDNMHIFNSANNIDMRCIANLRLLHEPTYICQHVNPLEFSHLIKRNSEMWVELVKQSYVTDSTVDKALRLKGISVMHKHFKYFVTEQSCAPIKESDMQTKIQLDGM